MALRNPSVLRILLPALLAITFRSEARAQEAPAPAPVVQVPPQPQTPPAPKSNNRLLTGKLIYVAPMPDNLDKWLQEDLRTWGRYRVTSNSEGVDLEIDVVVPERQTQYRERHGVPMPKGEPKKQPKETSISVVDWTTGAQLWSATLLNRNPKANEAPPAPAASIEIPARDMTSGQLALKITREFERYVEQLDSSGGH